MFTFISSLHIIKNNYIYHLGFFSASQTKFPAPVFEEEEDEENQPGTTAEEPVLPTSGDTGQAFNIRCA